MNWLIHLTEIRIGSDAPPQMRLTTRRLLIDDHLVTPKLNCVSIACFMKMGICLFVERWCNRHCSLGRTSKTRRSSNLSFEGFRPQISKVPPIYSSRHTIAKIRLTFQLRGSWCQFSRNCHFVSISDRFGRLWLPGKMWRTFIRTFSAWDEVSRQSQIATSDLLWGTELGGFTTVRKTLSATIL